MVGAANITPGFTGKSGLMPNKGNAWDAISANAGPAACPPKCCDAFGSSTDTAITNLGADNGAIPTNDARYFE